MLHFLKISFTLISLILIFSCKRGGSSERTPFHLNPNMDRQEKYKAQESNSFFEDESTMLLPPEGTIARGKLKADKHLHFGQNSRGKYINKLPSLKKLNFSSKEALLRKGRERYNIYCAACHGYKGDGKGSVAIKGYQPAPADLRIDRGGVKRSLGELYAIIATGYPVGNSPIKTMPAYNIQVNVSERWAIVAYLKVLKDAYNNYKDKEK